MTQPETAEDMELSLNFVFQAPIDLVFETLTLPEHLKHWHCPSHLNITSAESNPEVGGEYKIYMVAKEGDDTEMAFFGKFLEINQPDLLVYTQAFAMGDYPPTPETTITIKLQQDGKQTKMLFKQSGFGNKQSFEGAKMSWPDIYGKLTTYIESL